MTKMLEVSKMMTEVLIITEMLIVTNTLVMTNTQLTQFSLSLVITKEGITIYHYITPSNNKSFMKIMCLLHRKFAVHNCQRI